MYLRRREILPTLTQEALRDNAAEVPGRRSPSMPNLRYSWNIESLEGAAKSGSVSRRVWSFLLLCTRQVRASAFAPASGDHRHQSRND
jgi:hypothetical protein